MEKGWRVRYASNLQTLISLMNNMGLTPEQFQTVKQDEDQWYVIYYMPYGRED